MIRGIMRNFAFDGPVGGGKGTYLPKLCDIFEMDAVISLGDTLRAASLYLNSMCGVSQERILPKEAALIYSIEYDRVSPVINGIPYQLDTIRTEEVGKVTAVYCKSDFFKTDAVFSKLVGYIQRGNMIIEGRNCYHPTKGPVIPAAENVINFGGELGNIFTFLNIDEKEAAKRRHLQELERGVIDSNFEKCLESVCERNRKDRNHETPLLTLEQAIQSGYYNYFLDTTKGTKAENLLDFVDIFEKNGMIADEQKLADVIENWGENPEKLLSGRGYVAA